jgi:5'-3' exonuclease
MKRYLIVDLANLFFRARHSAHRGSDAWTRVGFAVHVCLASINKCWRDQKADHVVVCLEGRSWRKDFYAPYKKNRTEARAALTDAEQEEDAMFWAALDDVKTFFIENSNCTVMRHPELEADDLIAGWIQNHPQDHHTIVSTDSDFVQLLAENVVQYNGVTEELWTIEGIIDGRGRPVMDKKTQEPKTVPDPKWALFEKCMRGDSSDNVFSAYPGVRTRGTRNRVGLTEAYADKETKGFNWNNLMLQRWTDHNGVEHRVLDDYNRNVTLVDLTAQPAEIRAKIDDTIRAHQVPKTHNQVGTRFLKFCGKYELNRLSESAQQYAEFLGSAYPGDNGNT